MPGKTLDGPTLRAMVLSGAALLEERKREVDNLNVFPVPDGDTGTNMSLTANAAAREVQSAGQNLPEVANALANGALMGARGNSGVILSQLYRGLAEGLQKGEEASPLELAQALQLGSETAYRGVMKPKEGTMLTVSKDSARAALRSARRGNELERVLEDAVVEAERSVNRTPQLLAVLREAGVVDAGGMGVLLLLQGALNALQGRVAEPAGTVGEASATAEVQESGSRWVETELAFQYCTEFVLKGQNMPVEQVRQELTPLGDSLLAVGTGEMIKVHIHTNRPGQALETGVRFGSLHDIKIDNMAEQHRELVGGQPAAAPPSSGSWAEPAEEAACTPESAVARGTSVIAVAAGEGFGSILRSLGAEEVISGGETMNPSTEELVQSINRCGGERVVILPNNKNIFLAAQTAASLAERPVEVVPTRSLVQGIAALMAYNPDNDLETNRKRMEAALKDVTTGEVTYAARDTHLNGYEIQAGDTIGLVDGRLVATGDSISRVVAHLMEIMLEGEKELVTLYYGKEVSQEEAEELAAEIGRAYPDLEVEAHYGGQPLYRYVLAAE